MQFSDVWALAKRRWIVIVVCTLVGAAVGFGMARVSVAPVTYSSVAQVFVTGNADSVADAVEAGKMASSRINSYAALLRGPELTSSVIDKLHLDLTPSQLASRINPVPSADAVVLSFSVSDPDPARAQRLSDSVATELSDLIERLETPPNRKSPLVSAQPVGGAGVAGIDSSLAAPSPIRSAGMGAILGIIVGFGVAAAVDVASRRNGVAAHEADPADATPGREGDAAPNQG